jgi:hypothetical protein
LWILAGLTILFQSSYKPEASPSDRYSVLTAEEVPLEDFDDPTKLIEHYALTMLGKIILLEEKETKRWSGLRAFCRLDVSVFREKVSGKHNFFVNEITRSHTCGLFQDYVQHGLADPLFSHLCNVLHHVAANKYFLLSQTVP